MRPRKTIPKKGIMEIYGNWEGIKVHHQLIRKGGPIHIVYYYRRKGVWYPTTKANMIKRGIIVEG